jgi:hypothetical protein
VAPRSAYCRIEGKGQPPASGAGIANADFCTHTVHFSSNDDFQTPCVRNSSLTHRNGAARAPTAADSFPSVPGR